MQKRVANLPDSPNGGEALSMKTKGKHRRPWTFTWYFHSDRNEAKQGEGEDRTKKKKKKKKKKKSSGTGLGKTSLARRRGVLQAFRVALLSREKEEVEKKRGGPVTGPGFHLDQPPFRKKKRKVGGDKNKKGAVQQGLSIRSTCAVDAGKRAGQKREHKGDPTGHRAGPRGLQTQRIGGCVKSQGRHVTVPKQVKTEPLIHGFIGC